MSSVLSSGASCSKKLEVFPQTSDEKDLTKEEIDARIESLTLCVQDPETHRFFAPGKKWWLYKHSKRSPKDALLFTDQLGITETQMVAVYKSQWTGKIGKPLYPFTYLRKRQFRGDSYITVDITNEYDDYGDTATTPEDTHAIVTSLEREQLAVRRLRNLLSFALVESCANMTQRRRHIRVLSSRDSIFGVVAYEQEESAERVQ